MKTGSNGFSLRARGKSFVDAFKGLGYAVRTQHNLRIHIFILVVITALSFWLRLDTLEWAIIVVVMGFVLAMETMNTALEMLVNMVSPEWNPRAGQVKNLAAGAVMLSVITSVIVGLLVLGPPLLDKLKAMF